MSDKPEKIYISNMSTPKGVTGEFTTYKNCGINVEYTRADLAKPSEWISVDDRLPEVGEERVMKQVLVYDNKCDIYVTGYGRISPRPDGGYNEGFSGNRNFRFVTHWQPLPSPPDKETK